MSDFFFQRADIETYKEWGEPSFDKINLWWEEFKELPGVEHYQFYITGGAAYDINNTKDVDICMTNPINDLDELGFLLRKGLDLSINKYDFLVDLKWYSSIEFTTVKNVEESKRPYLCVCLPFPEKKVKNGLVIYDKQIGTDKLLGNINKKYPVYYHTVVYPSKKGLTKPIDYNKPPILLKP